MRNLSHSFVEIFFRKSNKVQKACPSTGLFIGKEERFLHPKYRADIDGLRALAVSLVVLYHAFPSYISGGFIGVDIFFVISGYLISQTIFNQVAEGTFSFSEFYGRRIKRIFPALIVMLMACLVAGWFYLTEDEYRQLGKYAMGAAGFSANFYFWQDAGYWDSSAIFKPLLHLWSLGVEEQFYLVWPLLIWSLAKFLQSGYAPLTRTFWHLLAYVVGGVLLLSFALNVGVIHSYPDMAFYSPYTRLWELLIGSVLAYSFPEVLQKKLIVHANRGNVSALWPTSLGLAFIAYAALFFNEDFSFPGAWALFPTLGAALLIASAMSMQQSSWLHRRLLSQPLIVAFGKISYPLYLWHWPLLSFAYIIKGGIPEWWVRAVCVLGAVFLAWLTYRYIETPLRTRIQLKALPRLLFLSMLVMWFLASQVRHERWITRSEQAYLKTEQARNNLPSLPDTLQPYISKGQKQEAWQGGRDGRRALFIGDSHMSQYRSLLGAQMNKQSQQQYSIFLLADGGCLSFIPGVQLEGSFCPLSYTDLPTLVEKSDVIVLSMYWQAIFGPTKIHRFWTEYKTADFHGRIASNVTAREKAYGALEAQLREWRLAEKKVYLVLDNPVGDELDPRRAVIRHWLSGVETISQNRLTYIEAEQRQDLVRRRLIDIANKAGVHIIDPMTELCDKLLCPGFSKDEVPMYIDSNHLNHVYVRDRIHYLDQTLQMK